MAVTTSSPLTPAQTDSGAVPFVPRSSVLSLDFGRLKTKLETYMKPEDVGRVEAAYHFSARAHEGQFRSSGEPYISHPVAVADIIADWHLDSQALIAALLHDVVEDTPISKQEIAERFGKVSAELVDGLKGVAVECLSIKSVLHIHLFKIAAAI